MDEIHVKKGPLGREVHLNGKMYRLDVGNQDARTLYRDMKRFQPDLAKQMERERLAGEWKNKIDSGLNESLLDTFVLSLSLVIKKLKR